MSFEEIKLMRNLSDFDVTLATEYVAMAQGIFDKLFELEPNVKKISDQGTVLGFRFAMTTPIYLLLSHQISRFDSKRTYRFNTAFTNYFTEDLGLIPAYIPSYNRMTVFKMWARKARQYFHPHNSPLDRNKPVCWQFNPSEMPPEMSSMNFILQYRSKICRASDETSSMMERYFVNLFWETGDFGMTSSTHFLHFTDKITGMINVMKTIFVIKKIIRKRKILIQQQPVLCYELLISGLCKEYEKYQFKDFVVFMESNIAESFKLDEAENRGFFNGVVTEIKTKNDMMRLFQIVNKYDTNYFELMQDLIGLVSAEYFKKSDTLSNVGTVEDIKNKVKSMVDLFSRETRLEATIGSQLDDWFERSVKELFPLLLAKNGHVYYVHPLIWSFFNRNEFAYLLNPNDPMLMNIIIILENILKVRSFKLRQMPEFDLFRNLGVNVEDLKIKIRRLATDILLAKKINMDHRE